jgi:hypothetical protein
VARGPYIGTVPPPCELAVGPTADSSGGRSATVGQPLVRMAVGRLPPFTVVVGVCQAGHVQKFQTAV